MKWHHLFFKENTKATEVKLGFGKFAAGVMLQVAIVSFLFVHKVSINNITAEKFYC